MNFLTKIWTNGDKSVGRKSNTVLPIHAVCHVEECKIFDSKIGENGAEVPCTKVIHCGGYTTYEISFKEFVESFGEKLNLL